MVRPGILTIQERRDEQRKLLRTSRKLSRRSCMNENRNIKQVEIKVAPVTTKDKIKAWRELKKKRLEEELKMKRPPFRNCIIVRHTGTSPFTKMTEIKRQTRTAVKVQLSKPEIKKVPLIVNKTNNTTGFKPNINLKPIPYSLVTTRSGRVVRNTNLASTSTNPPNIITEFKRNNNLKPITCPLITDHACSRVLKDIKLKATLKANTKIVKPVLRQQKPLEEKVNSKITTTILKQLKPLEEKTINAVIPFLRPQKILKTKTIKDKKENIVPITLQRKRLMK